MTTRVTVTVVCDKCGATLVTSRQQSSGARGDAERKGWRVSHKGDGYRSAGRSNDPERRDECAACQPPKPMPADSLLAEGDHL